MEGWEMGVTMSAEAIEARRVYQREYRRKNREKINSQKKEWSVRNRDRVRQYNRKYWEHRAQKEGGIRASWEDYGINKARYKELQEVARDNRHCDIVLSAALAADRKAAGHILLSVTENLSYEHIEFHERLGRCPLGRTNFYGARRLFFHYLDRELENGQTESLICKNMKGNQQWKEKN